MSAGVTALGVWGEGTKALICDALLVGYLQYSKINSALQTLLNSFAILNGLYSRRCVVKPYFVDRKIASNVDPG